MNVADDWYDPLSILYSNSGPEGDMTTIAAVPTVHVGCSVTAAAGNGGGDGCGFITAGFEAGEVPSEVVTVNVQETPAGRSETVMVVPLPVVISLPGLLVSVHSPEGSPLRTTLPVGTLHVGWVIEPISGAVCPCIFKNTKENTNMMIRSILIGNYKI